MVKWKKDKKAIKDLQNTTHKIKNRATLTSLKTGMNSGAQEGWEVPVPTCGTRRVALVTNPVVNHEWGNDVLFV